MGVKELHKRAFKAWCNMRHRCQNPNHPAWKWNGARGIAVCERWSSFANFIDDMGDPPLGLTIGRKDHDKGYDPENCCWMTPKQRNANQDRSSIRKLSASDVLEMRGMKADGFSYRAIASQFGIDPMTCYKAVNRKTYADVN